MIRVCTKSFFTCIAMNILLLNACAEMESVQEMIAVERERTEGAPVISVNPGFLPDYYEPLDKSGQELLQVSVINSHDHLYRMQDLPKYMEAANDMGITQTLFVASSFYTLMGENHDQNDGNLWNSEVLLEAARRYPGQILPFVTLHPEDEDKIATLERYRNEGAMGLKLYTGHGNFYEHPLDTTLMLPVYAWCEANEFPVCWHVNLTRYADEFEAVLAQFPKLKVLLPHFGVTFYAPGGSGMRRLESLLDTYPNLYTDTSFGTRNILVNGMERVSREPEIFQAFYEKYQDRIVWGTDMVVTGHREKTREWIESVIRACREMHEKEYYSFWMAAKGSPHSAGRQSHPYGVLRGLDLPEEILIKIYNTNIRHFLGLD